MPQTSIIMPVWNHLMDLTIPFLDKLKQTKGDWELILVDNGSDDGTADYLRTLPDEDPRIRPILLKENLGFGGGNNVGYQYATGTEICFISNDVILQTPDWLELLQYYHKTNPKAMIGPQLVDYNTLTQFDMVNTAYIAGWLMYGSKAMFDELKEGDQVFNEDFGTAYFEDVWLSVRAIDAGYTLIEVPCPVQHMGSKSSDQIDITQQSGEARLTFRNKMMCRALDMFHQKRIVFYAPGVPYGFLDGDYEGKGVGGAEASLIQLAREFANKGWRVEVYNKTDRTGIFNGVRYHCISEFHETDYCDVFVLFRSWHPVVEALNAKKVLFWSCDQYTDVADLWNYKVFPYMDGVVAISPYHKQYLESQYKLNIPVTVIDLGVKWEDYKKLPRKVKGKAIYCSVPMRGLELLAKYAPAIKAKIPNFNLTITSDYRLWGTIDPDNEEFVKMFKELPYVTFLGKISRQELVYHQLTSEVMAYPCTYDECFCISAMECMAAGAVPVTTDKGALPTTVGKAGIVLSNSKVETEFVDSIVSLFTDTVLQEKYRVAGRRIAQNHAWSEIINQWLDLIGG